MTFSEIFSAIYGANRSQSTLYHRAMCELRTLPPHMRVCWTQYRDRRVSRERGIGGLGMVAASVLLSTLGGCVTISAPRQSEMPQDCIHVVLSTQCGGGR